MAAVYRAPMRSRHDDIDWAATISRARALGVVGFGDAGADERLDRRIERFRQAPAGSFVWTRDAGGFYWLGRIDGPYRYDDCADAAAVDLVHVRPCRWAGRPCVQHEVPAAVIATFARGGRNFQQTHDTAVGEETEAVWHVVG